MVFVDCGAVCCVLFVVAVLMVVGSCSTFGVGCMLFVVCRFVFLVC